MDLGGPAYGSRWSSVWTSVVQCMNFGGPVLCPDGAHFADFIHHWEKVKFYPQLFHDGCSGNNIGSAMNTETLIIALFIDFTKPHRKVKADFCIHIECQLCSLVWPGRV